jgi:hypothetical protein
VPIWHKFNKLATLRCNICMVDKKGCSFAAEDWGINSWPILNITDAGKRRRGKETASKRKNRLLGAQEKVTGRPKGTRKKKEVASSPGVVNAGRTENRREVFVGVVITKPPPRALASIPTPALDSAPAADPDLAHGPVPIPTPAPSTTPAPSPGPSSAPDMLKGGAMHAILLQDVRDFEDALYDPSSSRIDLKLKAIEVRAISFREKRDVEGLSQFIDKRAEVLDRLADQLSDAGSFEEDDDMEDEEEGGCEVYDNQEEEQEDDNEQEEEDGWEQEVEDGDAEYDADTGEECAD